MTTSRISSTSCSWVQLTSVSSTDINLHDESITTNRDDEDDIAEHHKAIFSNSRRSRISIGSNNNVDDRSSTTFTMTATTATAGIHSDYKVLQSSQKRAQKRLIDTAIPANKLQFDKKLRGKLVGREDQVRILQECLKEVVTFSSSEQSITTRTGETDPDSPTKTTQQHKQQQLVLISGPSGVGKSALAQQLRRPTETDHGGMFVMGKHTYNQPAVENIQTSQMQPLAGISQACQDICSHLLKVRRSNDQTNKFDAIRHDLMKQFDVGGPDDDGEMIQALRSIAGEQIEDILGLHSSNDSKNTTNTTDGIPKVTKSHILRSPVATDREDSSKGQGNAAFRTATANYDRTDKTNRKRRRGSIIVSDAVREGEQLKVAVLMFLQIVSKHMSPLVIFLDDLQWIDPRSLETLELILTKFNRPCSDLIGNEDDEGNRNALDSPTGPGNLIVVGSYRSDEVSDGHPLSELVTKLKDDFNNNVQESRPTPTPNVHITEIEVGNLTVQDIQSMVSRLLSIDEGPAMEEKVQQLAILIHAKTGGNVFFVKAFLSMLVDEELLKFHIGTFKWDWDIDTIDVETTVTSNLVAFIRSRIYKLHPEAIEVLKLSACLGSSFEYGVLRLVWNHVCLDSTKVDNEIADSVKDRRRYSFEDIIATLVAESCLEISGDDDEMAQASSSVSSISSGYSSYAPDILVHFVHDKIQEGVLSTIPFAELVEFQCKVGMVLLNELPEDKLDSNVFIIVGLLAFGDVNSRSREFAKDVGALALRAARKAKHVGAFSCCLHFMELGISNIQVHNMWEDKDLFDLAIDLYSIGAEAAFGRNDFDTAQRCCDIVTKQEKASVLQKCTAYRVGLDLLFFLDQTKLLKMALKYLSELGCNFPSNAVVRRVQASAAIKKTLARIPNSNDINSMPMMTNMEIYETIQILEKAGSAAFLLRLHDLNVLIRCRYVDLVMKHGLTNCAASAFASFGNVVMHKVGDVETGVKLADLSLAMQDILPSQYYRPRTVTTAHGFVFQYVRPMRCCLKALFESYDVGLRWGNIMSAGLAIGANIMWSFFAGVNLSLILEDFNNFQQQMSAVQAMAPLAQLMQNLTNMPPSNSILLVGSYYDETKIVGGFDSADCQGWPWLGWCKLCKAIACCFFGEYKTGADLFCASASLDQVMKSLTAAGGGHELLSIGVCFYAAAQLTKNAKYVKAGNKVRSEIEAMVKKGFINHVHILEILNAEFYALRGKTAEAKESFEKAIVQGAKAGFIQNAALASERYSIYLLGIDNKRLESQHSNEAAYRLRETITYYKEWGAIHKVQLMQTKYKELLSG